MSDLQGSGGLRYSSQDVFLLVAVSLVWGAAFVFIRQGILAGATPLLFAASRYAVAAALFAAIAGVRREPRPGRHVLLTSAAVGGVFIIGLYGGLLYWGEQDASGGYAGIIASTAPLLTVAWGFWILPSERLGRAGLLGMAVGLTGTVLLLLPGLEGGPGSSFIGPIFILGAMVSTAFGSVFLRKLGMGRQGLWQIAGQLGVAGALLGIGAVLVPVPEALPISITVLSALAALVVLSSVLGYFGYFALHHRVGPVRANVLAYLAPIVAVGIGTGLFGEPLALNELLGVAIVLSGVSLVLWESARRQTTRPQ